MIYKIIVLFIIINMKIIQVITLLALVLLASSSLYKSKHISQDDMQALSNHADKLRGKLDKIAKKHNDLAAQLEALSEDYVVALEDIMYQEEDSIQQSNKMYAILKQLVSGYENLLSLY